MTTRPFMHRAADSSLWASQFTALCVVMLLLATAGCRRPVAQPPATRPAPRQEVAASRTASQDVDDESPVSTQEGQPQEAQDEAAASTEQASGDQGKVERDTVEVEQQPPELPRERLLLLTRDGPLLIDVIPRIDDRSHQEAFTSLIDEAFAEVGGDGDGEATWDALLDNPKFAYGRYGNLAPEDDSQREQVIAMYDNNRDGLVDRDELPRFLTRNVGGSQPFSLRSSNEYRDENRSQSQVRRLLDADLDGAIDTAEMAAAPSRLFARDADDDEILVPADFTDQIEVMQPGMSNVRRRNAPETAFLINEQTRWGNVSYALKEFYGYGDRVTADDIPLTRRLVAQIDGNGNGFVDAPEVPKLAETPPHLVLEIHFESRPREGEEPGPQLDVVHVGEELQDAIAQAKQLRGRLSMNLPGVEIELFANDDPGLQNGEQLVQGQFNMLDADSNGYLEEGEYPGQILGFNVPFAGLDADEDGMVREEEVLTLVRQRQAVVRSQIRARAADREDALFTALDTSGDGRLTAREIHGAPQSLRSMDRNGDGRLQSHEIPGSMAVAFVRGDSQNDDALFVVPTTSDNNRDNLPRWFRGMDVNGDGDISPREFLGSREKFQQLDADGDGFVSAAESQVIALTDGA